MQPTSHALEYSIWTLHLVELEGIIITRCTIYTSTELPYVLSDL